MQPPPQSPPQSPQGHSLPFLTFLWPGHSWNQGQVFSACPWAGQITSWLWAPCPVLPAPHKSGLNHVHPTGCWEEQSLADQGQRMSRTIPQCPQWKVAGQGPRQNRILVALPSERPLAQKPPGSCFLGPGFGQGSRRLPAKAWGSVAWQTPAGSPAALLASPHTCPSLELKCFPLCPTPTLALQDGGPQPGRQTHSHLSLPESRFRAGTGPIHLSPQHPIQGLIKD